ncbi:unnamed protein product [Polarella glacialis]|uniref:Uncharacterized protein n=1 Tax=Polarella glacialis TaxID=89957 RepID=A0A813DL11_POLGL|nr:unnamed protein product [Polarella glacialis]
MCGEGLADWKQMAGACAFEVPLATVTGQLRREMLRAVLAAKTYCGAFLDDYTRQYTQFQGPFAEFFTRFRKAKQQVLISVGGASGLPTSSASKDKGPQATSASSQQSAGGSWTEADLKNWLQFFATISASTRVSQADAYFGHALFGLCLRRIAQRFEIERTLAAAMAGDSEKAPEGEAGGTSNICPLTATPPPPPTTTFCGIHATDGFRCFLGCIR